ncbi:MAG TPA: hypothetical protein VGS27_04735 [Candidatus Sulfotelmatobacter sp.]|nr:hypothetical protein [Candidatus Sulfotelmatobacter sp.]
MKRSCRIAAAALLISILPPFLAAQSDHSSYDPDAHQGSSKPRDGFLDYTLKRINPTGANYGQCLGEGRTMLLEETVRNVYFWSNVVALDLLGYLFIVIVYQHRIQAKRDWTAAETLRQFEQSLARSRAQAEEATQKNHHLMKTLAALRESASRPASLALESTERAPSSAAKPRTPSVQPAPPATLKTNSAKPTNGGAARTSTAAETVGQMRLFTPDADFIMKLNSLEQQLAHSQEDNKQLRRRIADGDRRLEAEQERNRQLKGA